MKNNYTVIINVRNGEKYLLRAIEQIEKQTVQPVKIVIFDNASIDKTSSIIRKLVIGNPKIYISKKSKKSLTLYKARNLAIKFVKSKYICFLDVDDLWDHKKAEKQLEIFKINKGAIACLTEFEKVFEYKFNLFKRTNKVCSIDHANASNFYYFIKKYNIHFSSIMFDRVNLLENLGENPFNSKLTILGDLDFFIKVFGLGKVILLKENMTSYIFHDNNTGYKNYYRITFESLILAIEQFSKIRILRALYILYIYNLKYIIFLISKLKLNK